VINVSEFSNVQTCKRKKDKNCFINEQSKDKMTQRDKKWICFPQTKLNTEDRQTNEQNFKGKKTRQKEVKN
jgi:hypothetical protein